MTSETQEMVGESEQMNDKGISRETLIQEIEDLRARATLLEKSEQKYRQWFEDAPISLWEEDFSEVKRRVDEIKGQAVGDLDAYFHAHPDLVRELAGLVRVVDVNHATLRLYRAKTKQEFLSGITRVFARESFDGFVPALVAVAEGRTRLFGEKTHLTLDGQVLHIQLHWAVAPGREDTYGRVLVSIVDITQQKQVEIALERRSRERRLLLDTIAVQVWYLTDPDTYGALNRAHADFFGRHPRDMAYRRLEEFRTPDVAQVCRAGNIRVFEARKPVRTEEWVPNAVGEKRLIAVTKTPRLDDEGNVQYVVCAGVDITEQRKTEMLLRESEARLRNIFELSPVGIELYDREGRLILANPACLDIFGVEDAQEILSFRLFDDPNLDESLKQRLRRREMVQYSVAFDFEKVREARLYRTSKGGIIHLSVIVTPMTQEGEDKPTGYLAMVSDITARVAKEDRLRESEERFRLIAENTGSMIAILDSRGVHEYANPAYRKLGYEPGELVGTSGFALIHPEDLERLASILQKGLSGEICTTTTTYRAKGKDGRVYFHEGVFDSIRNNKGELEKIVMVADDVTERKLAEQALRREQMMLARTEGIAHVGSWEWDVATDTVTWSDELFRIFQRDPREGAPSFAEHPAFYHPDDMTRMRQAVEACVAEGVPYELELRAIRKDGETRVCVARGFAETGPVGRAVRLFGSIQDITERKRAEEEKAAMEAQNRQLQKAESLGRMAGAIAHHFNNKLGAVMGNLEMAMGDLQGHGDTVMVLHEAMNAAQKAAEVSRLMLTYLGQTLSKRSPLDLSEACRLGLPMIEAAMPKHVVLETDLPAPGPAILANANQVQQVVTNLVANAWESMAEGGGTIHLNVTTTAASDIPATHRFPIGWEPKDGIYACLEVMDCGSGIAEQDVEKLFDPFYSTRFTGRGMGLAVVLGIVRAHGGCITVEIRARTWKSERGTRKGEDGGSGVRGQKPEVRGQRPDDGAGGRANAEPGTVNAEPVGSVFRVYLPLCEEALPRPAEKAAKVPELKGGGTVLVIEDEPQLLKLAVRMIMLLGFEALTAKDGVEGVEVFREHQDQIRLVLSDLTMPRMDGWETLAALRKIAPGIPVILASGYDEARVMTGDHPEWPQTFLGKPYVLEDLREAIGRVVGPKAEE